MNGQELFEWLSAIPEDQRRNCTIWLEAARDNVLLTTAKVYDQNQDGKLDTIYLAYK